MHWMWITLLVVQCTWAQDYDLGSQCDFDENAQFQQCELDATSEIAPCNSSGLITTPNYPSVLEETKLGTYRFKMLFDPQCIVSLRLAEDTFTLASPRNSFKVGSGSDYNIGLEQPVLNGNEDGSDLPSGLSEFTYSLTTNTMWIELIALYRGASFQIEYIASKRILNEETFTESEGWLNSSYFSEDGNAYPQGAENRYFINTANFPEGDLLLTVHSFNITGSYGDYLLIGPGLDLEKNKGSVLVSWSLEPETKFLVDGNTAHLLFETSIQSNVNDYVGFSIHYKLINKTLTTPAPPTTTAPPPPTPIPLDLDQLEATLVLPNSIETLGKRSFHNLVAEILNNYLDKYGLETGWNLMASISDSSVKNVSQKHCYAGWSVNTSTCAQFAVYVESFQSNGSDIKPTFLRENVKAAVRSSNYYDKEVTLPDDLVDIYLWSAIIAAGVIVVVFFSCLVMWRLRLKEQYQSQKQYSSLSSSTPEIQKAGNPGVVSVQGYDNPSFVNDESGLKTYNPESRTLQSRSSAFGFVSRHSVSESSIESNTSSCVNDTPPMYRSVTDVPQIPPRGILKRTVIPPMTSSTSEQEAKTEESAIQVVEEEQQREFPKQESKESRIRRTDVPAMQLQVPSDDLGLKRNVLPLTESSRQMPSKSNVRRIVVPPMRLSTNVISEDEIDEVILYDNGPTAHTSPAGFQSNRGNGIVLEDMEGRGSVDETDL